MADISVALEELAAIVLRHEPLEEVLRKAALAARAAIPGADEVSITLIRDDQPMTPAFTGDLALAADEMQYERGYGPCLDAGRGGVVFVIDDMATETRWPDYAPKVLQSGVMSSLSIPLPLQDEVIGALDCYATVPHAFGAESVPVAQRVSAFIAVAVANATAYTDAVALAEQMQTAMATRAVIEQAKGILMVQNGCAADRAFEILVRASQRSNRKLREIATAIVEGVDPGQQAD